MEITQTEAIDLIQTAKVVKDPVAHSFPATGGEVILKLESPDHRDIFTLSIGRTRFELAIAYGIHHMFKRSGNIPILRLDVDAHDHRNPDAEPTLDFMGPFRNVKVGVRHFHVYMEGFDLAWAFPVANVDLLRRFGITRYYEFNEDHIENTRAFLSLINIIDPTPENIITGEGLI